MHTSIHHDRLLVDVQRLGTRGSIWLLTHLARVYRASECGTSAPLDYSVGIAGMSSTSTQPPLTATLDVMATLDGESALVRAVSGVSLAAAIFNNEQA